MKTDSADGTLPGAMPKGGPVIASEWLAFPWRAQAGRWGVQSIQRLPKPLSVHSLVVVGR